VAVKVQHPDIEARMATDFDILRLLVRFTERVFAASRVWQPVEHLEEIRLMLTRSSTTGTSFASRRSSRPTSPPSRGSRSRTSTRRTARGVSS